MKKNEVDSMETMENIDYNDIKEETKTEEKKMKKNLKKVIGLSVAGIAGLIVGGFLLSKKSDTIENENEFDYDEEENDLEDEEDSSEMESNDITMDMES